MQSALKREYRKMFRNLNGMRTMNRLPECLVVIDPKKEQNAVREARKLGITTVALIDTDCDPDLVDLPIPGNDDSIRSIELIVQQLADAVLEGKAEAATGACQGEGDKRAGTKRGRREPAAKPSEAADASAQSVAGWQSARANARRRAALSERSSVPSVAAASADCVPSARSRAA